MKKRQFKTSRRWPVRFRVVQWGDPWGLGIYGQKWRTHYQLNIALLWVSLILEIKRKHADVESSVIPLENQ